MNLGENIKNAFEVVRKTYENLYKLMSYLDSQSIEKGYEPSIVRFLRYSSDSNYKGWVYNNFIKLYQFKGDGDDLQNKWKDGPIYAIEFSFTDYPKMIVSKFNFDIKKWGEGIGSDKVNYFSNPTNLKMKDEFNHVKLGKNNFYNKSVPLNGVSELYWDLNYVIFKEFNLTDVNIDNANELTFGEFNKMRDME